MARLDPGGGIALITDGSANWQDRSGGWAWVALDAFDGIDRKSGHKGNTTNNIMELMAATEGLVTMASDYGPSDVLVYSDSLYVVLGAMDRTRARKKNKQPWRDLDRAMGLHRYVEFCHVKGHSGHLYNEMADDLAGRARRKGAK